MKKYFLEITVFIAGAVIMIFELVGSRIMAPYLGTSIFVWTSLIGVILGSLSIGYYLGGRIADKNPHIKTFSRIIFIAAVLIGIMTLVKDDILRILQTLFTNIRLYSVAAAVLLFAPQSVFLGMVSPYAIKLKMNNLKTSGTTVGNLYAISTIGSIAGTFFAGFFLIPVLGSTNILYSLAITLVLLSLILYPKKLLKTKVAGIFVFILLIFINNFIDELRTEKGFIDVDTAYNRVWIFDGVDKRSGKKAKFMLINNENSSAISLTDDQPIFQYFKFYDLASHFNPEFKKSLLLGGAGYAYPNMYLKKYLYAKIDVVEIDPKLTELAKKHFNLKDNPRLTIYHEDARVFLNRTDKTYDIIFGDAYKSLYSIPYQLTTKEAIEKMYSILNDDGVILVNIISAVEGDQGKFLRAEIATYKTIFPQVYLFPVNSPRNGKTVQNIILVALKSEKIPSFQNPIPKINQLLTHLWEKDITLDMPVLTDDYAPVEYYINKAI